VATVHLTRTTVRTERSLNIWGLKLRERLGFKRTAVAVARKLAVIIHSMLNPRQAINPLTGAAA
jgi:error-prone DNA polymerase